jgi:hypothetical protein
MNERELNEDFEELPMADPEVKPLPMLRVYGEGYIVRKDTGEKIEFTIQGEG